MTDLHTRLTAAITARLDVARAAEPGPWTAETPGGGRAWINTPGYKHALGAHGFVEEARYIASWDPTTAIRVLEALQEEIGEHYRTVEDDLREVCWECSSSPYPESRLWPCRPVRRWCRALGVEVKEVPE